MESLRYVLFTLFVTLFTTKAWRKKWHLLYFVVFWAFKEFMFRCHSFIRMWTIEILVFCWETKQFSLNFSSTEILRFSCNNKIYLVLLFVCSTNSKKLIVSVSEKFLWINVTVDLYSLIHFLPRKSWEFLSNRETLKAHIVLLL